jgi:hypothetical protein
VRRAGHRGGGLPDRENGDTRRDEDELPLRRRREGADTEGVSAPPDGLTDEPARLDGGDGGAIELGEKVARVQSGRSLSEGKG